MATKSLAEINIQIQKLQQQAAGLQKQADELRNHERATVIAQITAKVGEYGLTAADLRLSVRGTSLPGKKAATSKSKTKAPAKYRGVAGRSGQAVVGVNRAGLPRHWLPAKPIEEFKIR